MTTPSKWTKRIAAGAAIGALAIPAAAVIPAMAQDSPTPTTTTTAPGAPGATSAVTSRQQRRAARRAALEADVARRLGVSTESLDQAVTAARLDRLTTRLDAAVARGRLSREQADQILAAAKAGRFPGAGRLSGN